MRTQSKRSFDPGDRPSGSGLNKPFARIRFDFVVNKEVSSAPTTIVAREHAEAVERQSARFNAPDLTHPAPNALGLAVPVSMQLLADFLLRCMSQLLAQLGPSRISMLRPLLSRKRTSAEL